MANFMMHPPESGNSNTINIKGRIYNTAPGTPIMMNEADAAVAGANGWMMSPSTAGSGTTAQRPANPAKRTQYDDTTVGYAIVFDGKNWRNHVTGAIV